VNLTGVFLTCKYGIRELLKSGGGNVVLTASTVSLYGISKGSDAYSASKGGVYGLTRVLAADYGELGIRVNAVLPGFIDTRFNAGITEEQDQRFLEPVLLRRRGAPEEVASAIAFLASEEASYVTGTGLFVDGGKTAV
jgi:NAD(P)-dependent dehydrogenase (short-subunit alcohol dehydrogenase family)